MTATGTAPGSHDNPATAPFRLLAEAELAPDHHTGLIAHHESAGSAAGTHDEPS